MFKILFFEISQNDTSTDVSQVIELILKTYELTSLEDIYNIIAFRKNFIGTFKDGFFIVKTKKDSNWHKALAYLDFNKIEKLLLGGKNG